jgi:hypothetical protein
MCGQADRVNELITNKLINIIIAITTNNKAYINYILLFVLIAMEITYKLLLPLIINTSGLRCLRLAAGEVLPLIQEIL